MRTRERMGVLAQCPRLAEFDHRVGHSRVGVHSLVFVIHGCDASWSTRNKARRVSEPMLVRTIGGPDGTKPPSPARKTVVCSGVRKHCAPVNTYQASGPPECRCTEVGIASFAGKVASMYRATYWPACRIGKGPMTAMRSPAAGRHCAFAIANSQTLSRDSTTVLAAPDFAASAAITLVASGMTYSPGAAERRVSASFELRDTQGVPEQLDYLGRQAWYDVEYRNRSRR